MSVIKMSAQEQAKPSEAGDACAEMRALCSSCGGTGDVTRADGEWLGNCTCLHARLMQMSQIIRAGSYFDGNGTVFTETSATDTCMLDDILTDAFRLASDLSTAAPVASAPAQPDDEVPDHADTVLRVQKALGLTDTGWLSPDAVLLYLGKAIETAAPAQLDGDAERASFEAWMRKECGADDESLARGADGNYQWGRTCDMWAAYCRAIKGAPAQPMSLEAERVAFERWHEKTNPTLRRTRDEFGDYVGRWTNDVWIVWQARAALATQQGGLK